jgi:phosphatidylglycerophosphate synthase
MSHDTWIHRMVRPAIRPLTRSPVTPNHITWLRLLVGLSAAVAFAQGDDFWRNFGAGLFLISFLLDRADGELARLSGKHSVMGHKLDLISDALSNSLAFVGLGFGLRNEVFGSWALAMGALAGLAVAAVLVMVMRIEALEGQRSAELPSTAGFDPDDGMLWVPVLIWFGLANLLLLLAAVGAPIFCVALAVRLRRRLIDTV